MSNKKILYLVEVSVKGEENYAFDTHLLLSNVSVQYLISLVFESFYNLILYYYCIIHVATHTCII